MSLMEEHISTYELTAKQRNSECESNQVSRSITDLLEILRIRNKLHSYGIQSIQFISFKTCRIKILVSLTYLLARTKRGGGCWGERGTKQEGKKGDREPSNAFTLKKTQNLYHDQQDPVLWRHRLVILLLPILNHTTRTLASRSLHLHLLLTAVFPGMSASWLPLSNAIFSQAFPDNP